uniref:Protein Wnt n=1 Tax=Ailuropoda melanoleuca TaxID=9646 RepID=A0A7N5K3Y2_AILME
VPRLPSRRPQALSGVRGLTPVLQSLEFGQIEGGGPGPGQSRTTSSLQQPARAIVSAPASNRLSSALYQVLRPWVNQLAAPGLSLLICKVGIPQRLGQPKGVRRAPRLLPLSSGLASPSSWLGRSRQGGCAPRPGLSHALPAATRESAFVHAIASAGVAFAVTRSCAEGTSTICGCDSHHKGPPGEGWKWGGCSEDADFGVLVSREFADARENRPDARSAMNKHNNEAGRTTILDHMHLKCKCHGLSGSCEVKTCWWAQPDFRAIGDFLKDKYDSASEMVVEKHRESRGWVETLRAKYALFKPPTERDLVYYENSPNFCEPNPETGSFGTRDRTCNVTSHGIDGCDLLCCGRGHNTRTEKRKEKCHCIFHWCCYVSCQECIRIYDVHTCK